MTTPWRSHARPAAGGSRCGGSHLAPVTPRLRRFLALGGGVRWRRSSVSATIRGCAYQILCPRRPHGLLFLDPHLWLPALELSPRHRRRTRRTHVSFGFVALSGRTRDMEDAVSVRPGFFRPPGRAPLNFFAVFDGHGASSRNFGGELPHPPSMASDGSESVRRSARVKRKPLSDLTNAPSIYSPSSTGFSVRRPKPRRLTVSPDLSVRCSSSIGSNGPGIHSVPRDAAASDVKSEKLKRSGAGKREAEIRRSKGKPDVKKEGSRQRIAKLESTLQESASRWKAMSAHVQNLEKTMQSTMLADEDFQETTLSKDYIDSQKAYYAEVDAFELFEEVVSESELE